MKVLTSSQLILMSFIIVLMSSCQTDNIVTMHNITGQVQKGPFINGSSITIFDQNSDLSPSGKSFDAQITNDYGLFELKNVTLSSGVIKMRSEGFYYNEVLGKKSASQLTLYALSDITDKNKININVITHLEKSRVEYLVSKGTSFSDAKKMAQKEILSIFNIVKDSIMYSENLDISENEENNAILLAISSLLQGYRTESELTELMAKISNDLKADGILDSISYGSDILNHAIYLDAIQIRKNLADFYNKDTTNIPAFGKYIANFILSNKYS